MTGILRITVYGIPAPQGSKRAFAVRSKGVPTGRVAVIESSHDRVKSWRHAVIGAALQAVPDGTILPLAGPVAVRMTFWLPRPKSHYGTGRNAGRVKPGAPPVPAGAPDLSKLVRATEDAITDVAIWGSDAQVVECTAAKLWRAGGGPGAVIRIEPWHPGHGTTSEAVAGGEP